MRIKETLAPSHEKNRSGRLCKANMSALHAYSGGTVRDFHPIPYSSAKCGHSDKIYNYISYYTQNTQNVNIRPDIYAESA